MKHRAITTTLLLMGVLLCLMVWSFGSSSANNNSKAAESDSVGANELAQGQGDENKDVDADLGKWGSRSGINREEYLRLRDEYIARKRGIEPGRPFDSKLRGQAIEQMERQEKNRKLEELVSGNLTPSVGGTWTPIGPTPISNGDALSGGNTSVSGRVTAIVLDPGNANKVYLGTAQGGVWRSLDGGTTWAPIFDNSQSLAIGALALAPSNPTILYVGTGEFNGCADCYFGVGLYRIDSVDTTPTLDGPINPSETIGNLTYNVFSGRSISKIVVDPTNPATIFVSTARGIGGSGANSPGPIGGVPLGTRGVYRSTNATSAAASVTFQKLVVTTDNSDDTPATGNVDTTDIVMEPGNPNNLLVAVIGLTGTNGGIYRTTNALAGTPTIAHVYSATTGVRTDLAINKVGSVVTAYAATSETPNKTTGCTATSSGVVRKQVDPFNSSSTWATQLTGGGGFCGGQCFYDIAIAVNPNDANEVYLGGNARDSSGCSDGMKKSTDAGTSFTRDDNGLHADSHALFYNAAATTIFTGNDGGVWKRASNAAPTTAWTNLNNAPLNTLQFESIAVHPTDRNLMIGGTQDNGTEYQQGSVGNWSSAEGGDGGYCLIDRSATDTIHVNMYHTFFNVSGSQIGFDRAVDTTCLPIKDFWPTRGVGFNGGGDPEIPSLSCDGTANYLHNGLSLNDNVLFYAPMALGPGAPNTVYFGTDRLYRSTDRGDTMTVVSQASISNPGGNGSPISTIAISPGSDNVRLVGLQNGQVWATSTGSSTLVNLTSASFPSNPNFVTNKFVGRAVIDPNNNNVAYISFSFFAPAGQGIWKTTNLVAASGASPAAPVWTAAGNGIPSIPINALVIDQLDSNNVFAGTDIGVYVSTDGGANWTPFGTGLPRSAVFDLQIQPSNQILRAATHGRGVWETPITTAKANQTITVNTHAPSSAVYGASFSVAATSSSGLPVSFSSSGVCTNVGATFTMASGSGTCTVKYDQAGDSNYSAAPQVTESVTAQKAAQTITFAALANRTFGDPDFNVSATSTSNLAVSFSAGGNCSVMGTLVHLTSPGSCTISAKQAGDANFNAATDVPQTFSIANAVTVTAVASSLSPSVITQSVSFTATVSAAVTGTPTGTVQFKDGGANIGSTQALNGSAQASISTAGMSAGSHVITAVYSGDATYASSTGTLSGGQSVSDAPIVSFSLSTYNTSETAGAVVITVNRTGLTGPAVSVDYATNDTGAPGPCASTNGLASSRCDFTTSLGKLNFGAGETQKTFIVLVNGDSYTEGPESFTVNLSNPTGGAILRVPSTATVTIADDSSGLPANAVDDAQFFVRQHYHDFLNRQPDQAGLDFWTNQITSCGSDQQCIEIKRINVSAAFFLSIEFQDTGYLVERIYKASYGDASGTSTFNGVHQVSVPIIRFIEFLPDTQEIGQGVIVGQGNWQQQLEDNKNAFTAEFVQRSRFTTAFPNSMTAAQFVDKLKANAGNPMSQTERDQLVTDLALNAKTRAQVLRAVAEDQDLNTAEFNRAFVLMQYFGYLRRNPNDPQDTDYTGYDFWLTKLNQFNGNFVNADMVRAFIVSGEYRNRFGP